MTAKSVPTSEKRVSDRSEARRDRCEVASSNSRQRRAESRSTPGNRLAWSDNRRPPGDVCRAADRMGKREGQWGFSRPRLLVRESQRQKLNASSRQGKAFPRRVAPAGRLYSLWEYLRITYI